MKTYPLKSISLEEAMQFQFRMIDNITRHFQGSQILTRGDLGVCARLNKPETTAKVEAVIADFFNAEAAILVRGSGTAAIRFGMYAMLPKPAKILVHKAPIYPTTTSTLNMLGIDTISANFNDMNDIKAVMMEHQDINGALIQYTRQEIQDCYDMEEVIQTIQSCKRIPILTDDNYAVMKVNYIGTQLGADLSCFSTFKLLGPEGIGCIVGKKVYIDKLAKEHYSGGMQTQGWEALEVLHGLVYAPVSLAIQAQVGEEVVHRLNELHELSDVKQALIANAQSKVILVEFHQPIAKAVLQQAQLLGALPNPVGAESKYEMSPLFYRVSGTFRASDTTLEERMIRINPNRCGADTILRILEKSIKQVK